LPSGQFPTKGAWHEHWHIGHRNGHRRTGNTQGETASFGYEDVPAEEKIARVGAVFSSVAQIRRDE
jgi:hypothetical protein